MDNTNATIAQLRAANETAKSNADQWAAIAAKLDKELRQTEFRSTVSKLMLSLENASVRYQRKALRRLGYITIVILFAVVAYFSLLSFIENKKNLSAPVIIPIETFIGLMSTALVVQFFLERSKFNYIADDYNSKKLACERFNVVGDPQDLQEPYKAQLKAQLIEMIQPVKADVFPKEKTVEILPNIKGLLETLNKLVSEDKKP